MSEKEQIQEEIVEEVTPEVVEDEPIVEEAVSEDEQESACDELNTRYLRLLADFDNFKRRTTNEKNDIYKYGNMNLIKELLPVLDSFELAMKNAPSGEGVDAFKEGFEKLHRQLVDILTKAGLERINALNEQYDPTYHEAIMVVEDDSVPPNTIIDELRAGYIFKDKVLRPTVCRVTNNQ